MNIMIKIAEEKYNAIMNKMYCGIYDKDIYNAIINGIEIPTHHGDLIDVNKKITVPVYDDQYEEWSEHTLTILEAVNKWSNEGITAKDVIIQAEESEE